MTVEQLIAELQMMPPDLRVVIEDECCGCSNGVTEVCVSDFLVDDGGDEYVAISG